MHAIDPFLEFQLYSTAEWLVTPTMILISGIFPIITGKCFIITKSPKSIFHVHSGKLIIAGWKMDPK